MNKDVIAIRNLLRDSTSEELRYRRGIITLAAAGLIDFTLISLYQTGVLKRLPDPNIKYIDSNQVNASEKAYQTGLPDGTSGATMYGVIMMLASYGGSYSTGRKRYFDWLLLGLTTINSAAGLKYMYDMIFKQKRACIYCITGALINFGMSKLSWDNLKHN